MYEVDLYTANGTILPNVCQTLDEVLKLISESIDIVQLVNIVKL